MLSLLRIPVTIFILFLFLIIYYNEPIITTAALESRLPTTAFLWLGLSVVLWIAMFYRISKSITNIIENQKRIARQHTEEKSIEAVITKKSVLQKSTKNSGAEFLELHIKFTNFVGSIAETNVKFFDSKPEMRRYETGNTLKARVLDNNKTASVILEGSTAKYGLAFYILIAYMILYMGFAVWLYTETYSRESQGYGWLFLGITSPLILIPAFELFMSLMLGGVASKLGIGTGLNERNRLLFFGNRTMANVVDYKRTGMLYNDNPEIRYNLQFKDNAGKLQTAEVKKVVDIIHLHKVAEEERVIYYDPENPQNIYMDAEY